MRGEAGGVLSTKDTLILIFEKTDGYFYEYYSFCFCSLRFLVRFVIIYVLVASDKFEI